MADGGTVTTKGLDEFRQKVEQLPAAVTTALRAVALRSAERMRNSAARILREQQTTQAHALADAIEIVEDAPNKQFLVRSMPPAGEPGNVTIWNEYGTVKMPARGYMRKANEAERPTYERETIAAAGDIGQQVLG